MNTPKNAKLQQIKESVYEGLIAEFGEIPEAVECNQYEERLEERRDRYEVRSEAASQRSDAAYQSSRRATSGIPLGQPIMVGHHSEGRHRSAIARSDAGMRKSIDEQKKAEYYTERAASAGSGGIDSTDPDAIRKLMLKLLNLQIGQEVKKAANSIVRSKAKKYPTQESKIPALVDLGFSEAEANGLFVGDFCGRIGFPKYELSNNSANMKRIKQRIQSVGSLAKIEDKEYSFFDGWLTVKVDKEEGRVFLSNNDKPSGEVRSIYKSNGYKWSPSNEVWSRKLTNAGINSVANVRRALSSLGQDKF